MPFEFTSNIPADVVDNIQQHIFDGIDWSELAENVATYIDADDLISNVSRSTLEDIVLDNMDYSRTFDNIKGDIEALIEDSARDFADNIDFTYEVSDQISSLLNSYDPHNGCGLGKSFTDSARKAFMYLLGDVDFKNTIVKSLGSSVPESEPIVVKTEVTSEEIQEVVPLFNPDYIGVTSVVGVIAERYFSLYKSDPQFLVNLETEMWSIFLNTRTNYIQSVKEKGE